MRDTHHRRDFVRGMVLGTSVGLLGRPAVSHADEPQPKDEAPKSEVDARMEVVLARFGRQLDDDARKAVRADMEAIVRRAERLRKFELTNGDGPFPVFVPFRAPLA